MTKIDGINTPLNPAAWSGGIPRHIELIWAVLSLQKSIEALNYKWAESFGITEPQWSLLLALRSLDLGQGVSGVEVASKLCVDPSFVSSQMTQLSKKGLIVRTASTQDARVVLLSLSERAKDAFAKIESREGSLNEYIFSALNKEELLDLIASFDRLRERYSKALLVFELQDKG